MNDKSTDINNFGKFVEDIDDIRQCWYIIINTIKGSDPLRPDFGCGIFDYLDKPITSFSGEFSSIIIQDLERWETRTEITRATVSINSKGEVSILIEAIYTATGDIITDRIVITDTVIEDKVFKKAYSVAYNKDYK